MRVAVISDIHSNLAALRAVLADAGAVDETWCLGDLVGYGPQPNECIEELRRRDGRLLCIAGNHDHAVTGKLDSGDFNRDAEDAVLWTREQLTPDNLAYLTALPEQQAAAGFLLVHGSPRSPIWEYVVALSTARDNLAVLRERGLPDWCFLGHSHLPLIFVEGAADFVTIEYPETDTPLSLGEHRLLINPGSVGQPRDGNPAASYLLLDTAERTVTYKRVPYDIAATQRLMRETREQGGAGRGRLSDRLINRLAHGV